MTGHLLEEIAAIVSSGTLGIGEVNRLLACDWRGFYVGIPKHVAADFEVEHQFLIGMADEYSDKCWCGTHDQEMLDRLILVLRQHSTAQ